MVRYLNLYTCTDVLKFMPDHLIKMVYLCNMAFQQANFVKVKTILKVKLSYLNMGTNSQNTTVENYPICPLDYRTQVLSHIKRAIQQFSKTDMILLFGRKTVKPFTFSLLFKGKVNITDNYIQTETGNADLLLASPDIAIFTAFYNYVTQFASNKGNVFLRNNDDSGWIVNSLLLMPMKLLERTHTGAVVKTLSPIAIRNSSDPNKYVVPKCKNFEGDSNFMEYFYYNLKTQIFNLFNPLEPYVQTLTFEPINLKRTIVKHRIKDRIFKIPAFKGLFYLKGNPELINLFLMTGIGARRSQGFGMITLVEPIK